jgi:hypothetical protein
VVALEGYGLNITEQVPVLAQSKKRTHQTL